MSDVAQSEAVKRSRGRPKTPDELKKVVTMTFRSRASLRRHLAREAKAAGRSLSEEIDYRLSISTQSDVPLEEPAPLVERMADLVEWLDYLGGAPDSQRVRHHRTAEEVLRIIRDLAEAAEGRASGE
jgi:hypothetical protein